MSDAATYVLGGLTAIIAMLGSYEIGLQLGWSSRNHRAAQEMKRFKADAEAIRAEFQERRGRNIDTRA